MEKRLLIAIVLSFVVLLGWQFIFVNKEEPPPPPIEGLPVAAQQAPESLPPTALEQAQKAAEGLEPEVEDTLNPDAKRLDAPVEPVSGEREQEIRIDTPIYRATWNTRGAVLTSWRLKLHTGDNGEDLELVSSAAGEIGQYPLSLRTGDPELDALLSQALFLPSRQSLELMAGEAKELRFEYADERGNRVEKIMSFRGEGYDFDLEVNLWKDGQKQESYVVWGPGFGNLTASQGGRMGSSPGISVYSGAKVLRHDERKYKPEESAYNFVNWASYDDQYFTAMLIGTPGTSSALFSREMVGETQAFHFLNVSAVQKVYLGPKQYDQLSDLGHEAKRAIRFGIFGFITEILYVAIKAIYNTIPNWGWSIVILTIAIKILFFPLTYQSTKSMSKMQKLQPKIKAVRNKYKKAKQDIEQRRKLNEETMRIYKEEGVNPAGGCLPMLIQLPIFWGFFQLLRVAVEFRHSPWILWIGDLSVKDPYYVIPVLMGITQFISQKMTPTSGDATQQRMMLIMPVIMTVFFISFPSGLVLYWLTNNVLQIGQQYIMNRYMHKKKKESHGKPRKK